MPRADRAQVEAGAAGQDRDAAARGQAREHALRVRDEVGDAERLVRIDQVETVVGDPRPLGGGGLGRPDVEAPVDLARIGGDDLDRSAARRERLGELDRERGLAGRGRAADDDERRRRGHADARRPAVMPDRHPAQRVGPGVLDADRRPRGRRAPAGRPGGRACCRASGR